jgi:uncharacterized protein YhaN
VRIKGFRIDGFGLFHQIELPDLPSGLLLFEGANEAGKSTLLGFLRAMLFGFVDGRSRENAYPPLASGRHGGGLTLLTDAGRELELRRTPGPRGGRLEVIAAEDGARLAERELERLCGGVGRSLYSSVFAFSLGELQSLETAGPARAIYAAASGASVKALARTERHFSDELERLFRPRGRKDELHRVGRELERVRAELERAREEQQSYQELLAQIAAREARLGEVESALRETRRGRRRAELDLRLLSPGLEWRRLQAEERGEAPPAAMREVHLERERERAAELRVAEAELARVRMQRERLTARMQRMQAPADGGAGDGRGPSSGDGREPVEEALLLAQAETIDGLLEAREGFRRGLEESAELEAEAVAVAREQAGVRAFLGRAWDEARVRLCAEATAGFEVRAELRRRQEELRRGAEARRGAQGEVERLLRESGEAEGELERAARAVQQLLAGEEAKGARSPLSQRRQAVATHLAAAREEQEERRRRAVPWAPPWVAGALATGGALLAGGAALGWWTGVEAIFSPGAGGGGAAETAETALGPGSPGALEPGLMALLLAAGVSLLGAALALWFFDLRPRPAAIDPALEERIAALEAELKEQTRQEREQLAVRRERLQRAELDRERLRNRLRTAQQQLLESQAAKSKAEATWRAFLTRVELPANSSVADALELLEQIRRWARLQSSAAQLQQRRARLRAGCEEFGDRAADLYQELHLPLPAPELLGAALGQLGEQLREAKRIAVRRAEIEEELAEVELELHQMATARNRARVALEQLWGECGVADAGAFEQAAAAWRTAAERQQRERQLRTRLLELAGLSAWGPLEEHLAELEGCSEEALKLQIEERRAELQRLEEERDALQRECGRLRGERQRLADSDTLFALRAREEQLRARLRALALEWSETALAAHLLRLAKARFEEEHQPAVLRHATGFLQALTGGRHQRVIAPPGKRLIEVVAAGGQRRSPAELSRGTAEQLCLALRFGFIRNHAAYGESLPVVMDDVLVNFDPERAARAADAILQLAERNQVLFFSCHPESIALLRSRSPEVPLFTIAAGGIAPTKTGVCGNSR